MPSKYPTCTPYEVCAVLKKAGFRLIKQKGSHAKYSDGIRVVVVPMHKKDLKIGTLIGILEQSDIPLDKFVELL